MGDNKISNKAGTISIAILTGILIVFVLSLIWVIYMKANRNVEEAKEDIIYTADIDELYSSVTSIQEYGNFENYYKEEKITNDIILSLGAKKLGNKDTISSSDLDLAIKEIFGSDIIYNNKSFNYNCNNYEYKESEALYEVLPVSCENTSNNYFLNKKGTVYEDDNVLIIYEKFLYLEGKKVTGSEYDMEVTVYSDYNKTNSLDIMYANKYTDINIDDYELSATIYKYIFNKKDGKYYFESFSR